MVAPRLVINNPEYMLYALCGFFVEIMLDEVEMILLVSLRRFSRFDRC